MEFGVPTTWLLTLEFDLLYIEQHQRPRSFTKKASNEHVVAGLFVPKAGFTYKIR
jgi:hypothetical protein